MPCGDTLLSLTFIYGSGKWLKSNNRCLKTEGSTSTLAWQKLFDVLWEIDVEPLHRDSYVLNCIIRETLPNPRVIHIFNWTCLVGICIQANTFPIHLIPMTRPLPCLITMLYAGNWDSCFFFFFFPSSFFFNAWSEIARPPLQHWLLKKSFGSKTNSIKRRLRSKHFYILQTSTSI